MLRGQERDRFRASRGESWRWKIPEGPCGTTRDPRDKSTDPIGLVTVFHSVETFAVSTCQCRLGELFVRFRSPRLQLQLFHLIFRRFKLLLVVLHYCYVQLYLHSITLTASGKQIHYLFEQTSIFVWFLYLNFVIDLCHKEYSINYHSLWYNDAYYLRINLHDNPCICRCSRSFVIYYSITIDSDWLQWNIRVRKIMYVKTYDY